jgi:hypothetical protein
MNKLEVLIRAASEDELRTLVGLVERVNAHPAVMVTLQEGRGKRRRYVVYQEDEHLFDGLSGNVSREQVEQHFGSRFAWFGGQWLRSMGRVDEMARTLSVAELVKVERRHRNAVWGTAE